jgi:hypothetical protein
MRSQPMAIAWGIWARSRGSAFATLGCMLAPVLMSVLFPESGHFSSQGRNAFAGLGREYGTDARIGDFLMASREASPADGLRWDSESADAGCVVDGPTRPGWICTLSSREESASCLIRFYLCTGAGQLHPSDVRFKLRTMDILGTAGTRAGAPLRTR